MLLYISVFLPVWQYEDVTRSFNY